MPFKDWRIEGTMWTIRPAAPGQIADVVGQASGVEVFCELPWSEDPGPWVDAVAAAGARAKTNEA